MILKPVLDYLRGCALGLFPNVVGLEKFDFRARVSLKRRYLKFDVEVVEWAL